MKQEFSKNKELQESLRKFREDAKKLEDSQDLKDARRKFESIEGEIPFYSVQFKKYFFFVLSYIKTLIKEKPSKLLLRHSIELK